MWYSAFESKLLWSLKGQSLFWGSHKSPSKTKIVHLCPHPQPLSSVLVRSSSYLHSNLFLSPSTLLLPQHHGEESTEPLWLWNTLPPDLRNTESLLNFKYKYILSQEIRLSGHWKQTCAVVKSAFKAGLSLAANASFGDHEGLRYCAIMFVQ